MTIIAFGTAQVAIRPNDGGFYSVMTVNGGETVVAWRSHETKKGAERWANKMLKAHAGVK
jgi:hypothetical protein